MQVLLTGASLRRMSKDNTISEVFQCRLFVDKKMFIKHNLSVKCFSCEIHWESMLAKFGQSGLFVDLGPSLL